MKFFLLTLMWLSSFLSLASQNVPENHAESVVPFAGDLYFSNTTAGHIQVIGEDGKVNVYAADVGKVLGLAARGKYLYAAANREDGGHLLVYAPPAKEVVIDIHIPEAQQLNDIAVDSRDMLYVTDRLADRIHAIDMSLGNVYPVMDGQIKTPNGICVDESLNRLLICNTVEESSIYSLDLRSGKVTELLATGLPHLDGLAMDRSGFIYVSSWSEDWKKSQLIRYSPIFSKKILQENENGMADLYLYPSEDKIALANWYPFSVTVVTWENGVVKEVRMDKP